MTTLTEFLLARITEDEAAARADLESDRPHWAGCSYFGPEHMGGGECDCNYPARVLAECEAKRRIVEAHPLVADQERLVAVWSGPTPGVACETCHGTPVNSTAPLEDIGPCETLLALAAVYADHEDFQEEWRV